MNRGILASRRRDAFGDAFTATYQIDDISEPLTLPVTKDYQIDWGDGVTTTTGNQHVYSTTGVKTVKMIGVVDDFRFANSGDKDKILTVEQGGGFVGFNGQQFRGCSNLISANLSGVNFITSSFRQIFEDCISLTTIDLTGVGSAGSQMRFSFKATTSLLNIVGLQDLDTTSCQNFDATFINSAINQDVSNWDYSSAKTVLNFMAGKSPANYDYQFYDNLLIKWASGAANGGLDFTKLTVLTTNFGSIQYSSAGAAAHDSLVSQGLIITDGGQNAF